MSPPASLNIALKEWATVCTALETGRQALLLRKGGISEDEGEFRVEHRAFLLFPTYLHQNPQMVKEADRGAYEAWAEEPERIKLSGVGVVTDIVRLASRAQMDALYDEHVWTPPLIDMRFGYKPEKPLYLMFVRGYRLAEPVTIDNTPAYAGCKSWVPLDEAVAMADAVSAVDDEAYAARRAGMLERVERAR